MIVYATAFMLGLLTGFLIDFIVDAYQTIRYIQNEEANKSSKK